MRSILLAEDNPLVYHAINSAFSRRGGFTVEHALDGRRAIAALTFTRPDLALIDVSLPDISGIDIARHAVELKVPTVLMTGYGRWKSPFPVIIKPFRVFELVSRIDEVIAESARLNRIMAERASAGRLMEIDDKDLQCPLSEEWGRLSGSLLR